MEKSRSLKELYQILYNEYQNTTAYFICNLITVLYSNGTINSSERVILNNDFKSQKPSESKYLDFYMHDTFDRTNKLSSWWRYDLNQEQRKEAILEKLRFLKKLLDNNS